MRQFNFELTHADGAISGSVLDQTPEKAAGQVLTLYLNLVITSLELIYENPDGQPARTKVNLGEVKDPV